ncbi:siderophore ABC transporter substrate-binding protein [Shimia sp. CNT1-13L.2]|uniref:siderophore ABC transporter substrate-binding protein n=1 Tax=Shimia sp. CNT1-13L.2 TaxID=2959663 RepID=UPI0020CC3432|nr:siderophore ABC transporter substrate-binding protein [Shimia sp. CNT1-13L.2]MCP9484098.1 siderophore ABC transporter substrate-binding protein [Shimia sp. CNT1-13L.2]
MAEPRTIETAKGAVSFDEVPTRIAALDVAALDTLSALGIPVVAAPGKVFVNYLDGYLADVKPAGSLFEPDYEALAIAQPDLIVAGGRSSTVVPQLERVAPTIDMTIWGEDIIGIGIARLEAYGALLGKKAEAEALAAALADKHQTAKDAVKGKGNALIVLTNGPKISAYGKGSRFGWLHTALGLPEAREGVSASTHGEAISFEFIAETNPDWLLVVDRGAAIGAEGASAMATLDNALVQQTTAWRKGQVVSLSASNIYVAGGGVRSVSITLDEIIAAFTQ